MGETTGISWADATFNPWWGCTRVSEACRHCYAETLANRYGHAVWGSSSPRRAFSDKHWAEPVSWDRKAAAEGRRLRVFCASMADVFEAHVDLPPQRRRLWGLIAATPNIDWLILTKRPENIRSMVPPAWLEEWPANAWPGTTVESQRWLGRVGTLLELPAPLPWLSCEPLLGRLDLTPFLGQIRWVITGGESGPGHRPPDPDWIRSLRDQCTDAGVAFHFKQWGGRTAKAGGKVLDGREWCEVPAA